MAKKAVSKVKKVVKTRSSGKKKGKKTETKSTEVVYHSTKEIKVEKALIDNFIGLQKVMVNLSARFDNLSNQISKLLELFEIAAKSLARKEMSSTGNLDAEKVIEKLDNISRQAGLIGRGLALIHEVGTENQNPVIPLNLNSNQQINSSMPLDEQTKSISMPTKAFPDMTKPLTKSISINSGLKGFQKSVEPNTEKGEGVHPSSG